MIRTGPTNTLTDVPGIRVGHAQRIGDGWLSGTTVVLAPDGGACAGVDVRGGGPGTRETDLLHPSNVVQRVDAVVLSGGSAFGLATADGVVQRLFHAGIGFPVGGPGEVVPIVPGAVIFDLGRGGDFSARPDASLGASACDEATANGDAAVPLGTVGAGTGAKAGGLKGGVGSASVLLDDGTTVAALAVVNSVGSCVDPRTGKLYAAHYDVAGEFEHLQQPSSDELITARQAGLVEPSTAALTASLATTIGVVATDATLTKAQCAKVSGIAHDGMARAIRPVHTMFDGDTVFTMATGARETPELDAFQLILDAAGDCFTRAVGRALLAAETVETPAGRWPSYRDVFPSAFRGPAADPKERS